jgi:excinuclease ABC subunit A
VIKNADWIIDIGPEGGAEGGQLMFEGSYAELKKLTSNWTAKFV